MLLAKYGVCAENVSLFCFFSYLHCKTEARSRIYAFFKEKNEKKIQEGCLPFFILAKGCLNKNKAINTTCLKVLLLCLRVCGRQWCLTCEVQNQATDTGWVCCFPQTAKQKTQIYFPFTRSQLKKEVEDEGVDGLKQEMTSVPLATQLTIMIKKGDTGWLWGAD